VTENEYKEHGILLTSKFATAETVCGNQQLHAFMPVTKGVLNLKIHFASLNCTENHFISVLKDVTELKDIKEFATCMYDNFCKFGCVLSITEKSNGIKISFFILMALCNNDIKLYHMFCSFSNQQF
jgi:hypothetical protein